MEPPNTYQALPAVDGHSANPRRGWFVADEADRIIGFGGHKGNYISWLFVHPAHRRQGVARALLREIMGRLKGPITLNVGPWNQAARNLYDDFGFVVAREFTGKFNGYDVGVLTLVFDRAG